MLAIELDVHFEALKTCFDEKEDTSLADVIEKISSVNLARFTRHKSQLC